MKSSFLPHMWLLPLKSENHKFCCSINPFMCQERRWIYHILLVHLRCWIGHLIRRLYSNILMHNVQIWYNCCNINFNVSMTLSGSATSPSYSTTRICLLLLILSNMIITLTSASFTLYCLDDRKACVDFSYHLKSVMYLAHIPYF